MHWRRYFCLTQLLHSTATLGRFHLSILLWVTTCYDAPWWPKPRTGNLGQAPNTGRRCHAGQPHSVAHAAVFLAALLAALGVRHGTTSGLGVAGCGHMMPYVWPEATGGWKVAKPFEIKHVKTWTYRKSMCFKWNIVNELWILHCMIGGRALNVFSWVPCK